MKLVLLFVLTICIMGNTCGGNCPGNNCPNCPCGTSTSPQSITYWCSKYNWNQACCQCVMSKESGGNANALRYDSLYGQFYAGLWLIREYYWRGCSQESAPCNITTNLNCAIEVYKLGGNTFTLWPSGAGCGCA